MTKFIISTAMIFSGFLSFANSFWEENKACYWETECIKHQNNTKEKKSWEVKYRNLVQKILKQGGKFLDSLPPEEVKKLYNEIKNYAVAKPTEENLRAFTYMTDYIRKKSLNFMYAYTDFINRHPEYNMGAKVGGSSWSYRYIQYGKSQYILRWLRRNSDKVGIYFVCDGRFSVCKEAAKPLKEIVKDGISILSVSPHCDKSFPNCEERADAFKLFRVKLIPAYYVIVKKNNKPIIRPIGQGLIPVNRLLIEAYRQAQYVLNGRWIDATQIPIVVPVQNYQK